VEKHRNIAIFHVMIKIIAKYPKLLQFANASKGFALKLHPWQNVTVK